MIDALLAGPDSLGGAVVGSNERLPGDLNARAVFAFDGNAKTFWSPGFDAPAQVGAWIQASLGHSVNFDHLALELIADGRHSVPTEIRITTNTGGDDLVRLPAVRDRKPVNSVVSVPLSFPRLTGTTIRFTVEAVRRVTTTNWYTQSQIVTPVGIAEIGLPGVHLTPELTSAEIPSLCTSKLLSIDGRKVWLKISGTVGAAEKLQGLSVKGCGPDAKGILLGPGTHNLTAAWGKTTGWDLDRLVLDSAPGGGPLAPLTDGSSQPVPGTVNTPETAALATPMVKVLSSGATSAKLEIHGAAGPFWLVLGESLDPGWEATGPGGRSLGVPQLIDGYANGWYMVPPPGGSFVVTLQFGPQRIVTPAIFVSGATLAVCLLLGFVPIGPIRRRLRRRGAHSGEPANRGARPVGALSPIAAESPLFASIFSDSARARNWFASILFAVACGAVSAAVLPPPSSPLIAGAIALEALVSLRLSQARSILGLSALLCLVAAGAVTVVEQVRHHYLPGSSWPHNFEVAGVLAFVGVVALGAQSAVELARQGRRRQKDDAGPP